MEPLIPHHTAILVENIEEVVTSWSLDDANLQSVEEFESEGTRELYVGQDEKANRLLLIQPTSKGPYLRAFEKRGAGLHPGLSHQILPDVNTLSM